MKKNKRQTIFHNLSGAVSYRPIERWRKMIQETIVIDLTQLPDSRRTVRTKTTIQKIKRKSHESKRISCRKLAFEMDTSFSNGFRILGKDRKMRASKTGGSIKILRSFPQKIMVWLVFYSEGISPLVLFQKGTLDRFRYIKNVIPVALR